jgi:iron-sulfur cluster assembly protein
MFKLTSTAAKQVIHAAEHSGAVGLALRLAAYRDQEDGSIAYRMGFDQVTATDIHYTDEGIEIVIAPEFMPLLENATMDFVTLDDGQRHFIFLNPSDPTYQPPHTTE